MIQHLSDSLYRIAILSNTLAPFKHTNSYLIANQGVGLWIDAPSASDEALHISEEALAFAKVKSLKALVLSHTHPDHCEGTARFEEHFKVHSYVHPLELERYQRYSKAEPLLLDDKRFLTVGNSLLRAMHTPGHSPGHLSFYLEDEKIVLAGDLLTKEGSTWVGLPDGDVNDYLVSLARLERLELTHIACGHGEVIDEPYARIKEVKNHRQERLAQVLAVLEKNDATLEDLRQQIYPSLPHPEFIRLADASLLALLKKHMQELKVLHLGKDINGPYALRK